MHDMWHLQHKSSVAPIKQQALTGIALSIQIVPFGFEQSDHLQMQEVPGEHKLRPLIDYLSSVTSSVWYGCNEEKLQDVTTF